MSPSSPGRGAGPLALLSRLGRTAREIFSDAIRVTLDLYKIMVPVILAVKALQMLDLAGLPASMGLVWATAILVNLYSAIVVYASLAADLVPLTAAQVTVLASMMLVAHALPVELRIAQKCGASLWGQAVVRLGGAVVLGVLLHLAFSATSTLQEPAAMLWTPPAPAQAGLAGLPGWAADQAQNLGMVFLVVLGLMGLMRLLRLLRVPELLDAALKPLLRLIGIGREAATLTVIGLTLGLTYGAGLLIHESRSGRVGRRDILSSVSLLGLSHALIEDTLLMLLIGARMVGTLWGRLLFSLAAVALIMRALQWRRSRAAKRDKPLQAGQNAPQ
jgi:hypothetical protein